MPMTLTADLIFNVLAGIGLFVVGYLLAIRLIPSGFDLQDYLISVLNRISKGD